MRATRTRAETKRRSRAAVLVLVLASVPVVSTRLRANVLDHLLHSEAERRGRHDQLAEEWLGALREAPGGFRAELAARRLIAIEGNLRRPAAIVPALEQLLEDGVVGGTPRQVLIDLLGSLYRRAGRRQDDLRLQEGRGLLGRYLIIGPFGKATAGDLRREFPPERGVDLSRSYRDAWQELRWRFLEIPVRTRRDATDHVYPSGGIVYFLSQLHAAKETIAALHLVAKSPVKLWVRGHLLVDDSARREYLEARRVWRVRFEAGWNRILVKTRGDFRLRLSDLEGNPLPPDVLREEREGKLHDDPPAAGDDPAAGPVGRPMDDAISRWEEFLAAPAVAADGEVERFPLSRALEHVGLALLHRYDGRSDLAVERVEQALELAPEDPHVLYHAAGVIRRATYLPPNLARNRARDLWEKTVGVDPGFLPAHVRLARHFHDSEKDTVKAVEQLRGALDEEPGYLDGLRELERIYRDKGWDVDARRVVGKIEQLAPDLPLAPRREASHYHRLGAVDRAIDLYWRAYGLDRRQTSLLSTLARLELRRRRPEEAERLFRQRRDAEPDSHRAARELTVFLSAHGKHDAALEIERGWVEAEPWNPQLHRRLGVLLERAGRPEEAKESYREALRLAPGDLDLRRYLSHVEQRDDEFWKPHDEALEDWIGRVPEHGPLVEKAKVICILDISVIKVYDDGSSREYVHQAFRLLTEDGKEQLAEVVLPGRIVALRTVQPDGEVLEPVNALGRNRFVMPGLVPGAVTQFAYVTARESAAGRPFETGGFFFQDFRYRQSFLLSRYVLILPPGFDGGLVERHLRSASPEADLVHVEKTEQELPDGGRLIVYEARNSVRLEAERGMPASSEYVPNVRVLARSTLRDVAEQRRSRVRFGAELTPEIRRAAAAITEGTEDPLGKARAIYAHVSDLVADGTGTGSAVRVLLEKSGDRTVLFKTLLDAAGVPSSWAFLRSPEASLPRTEWSFPRASMFPSRYVLLEVADNEPYWLDLSLRRTPFGRLPERFSGGTALVLTPRGQRLLHLPRLSADDHGTHTRATYRLSDDTATQVELNLETRTTVGYAQKERFRSMPAFQKGLLGQTMASRLFPGAKVKQAVMPGLDEDDVPFTYHFELSAPRLLRPSGEEFLLSTTPTPYRLVRSFGGSAERKHPFHLRSELSFSGRLRFSPGSHYEVRRLPDDVALLSALGSFTLRYRREEDDVLVERRLFLRPGRLEADEFSAFLEFCEKVDAAERESVTLRRRTDGER
ncbi:MAG: tetratricopeptide repeat protein [Planctomycetota bacterium]|nr:tetratricopeptide repeat protein [Planctomycetota bacterium]